MHLDRRAWTAVAVATVVIAAALILLVGEDGEDGGRVSSVFDGAVACEQMDDGIRFCGSTEPRSTVASFDGVPVDVNVGLPAASDDGRDRDYPLVMGFHGYGGAKFDYEWMAPWLAQGYAALSLTARGFHETCGTAAARNADPAGCADGYNRLMDTRYEVRDAQHLAGLLVDEGVVSATEIAATGGSYGGGLTLALAALRDRVMLRDGELREWRSPDGTPIELAAAVPTVPWSEFATVFLNNGSFLDYVADRPYGAGRPGIEPQRFVDGIAGACDTGYCTEPGTDPEADVRGWIARLGEGEPYEGDPRVERMLDELAAHHSAYGIEADRAPAPLLLIAGFTDDVVPVSEALRFYNRSRTEFPDSPISLLLGDLGHMRAQNAPDPDLAPQRTIEWIDHYVRDEGPEPPQGVTAITQTCPTSAGPAEVLDARDWASLAAGEVRLSSAAAAAVLPNAPNPRVAAALDPQTPGAACNPVSAADQPGTASYRTPPARGDGFTLVGAPTVIADLTVPNPESQLHARLLDVAPNGSATLVARAVFRPEAGTERQVFQLQANAWRFEPGHAAKLELLPSQPTFWRPSNRQRPIAVSGLELRLPVREEPGAAGGMVRKPAPEVLPPRAELAAGFER